MQPGIYKSTGAVRYGNRKALLPAMLILIATVPSTAQNGSWYSLRSKCNIEISRHGDRATLIVDGKACNAVIEPSNYDANVTGLSCGGSERLSFMLSDGELIVLNDKYQHGCEASKVILMDSAGVTDPPESFRVYLADHDYILDDTAAVLAKAKYMNGKGRFGYSRILLDAFIARRPGCAGAFLQLADACNGENNPADASRYYRQYLRLHRKHSPGTKADSRSY